MQKALVVTLALFGLAGASATLSAQDYPTKPVRIIVPFSAGGGTDLLGRIVAEQLSQRLGQSFYVENRPGAGGILGTEQVAKSDPDGYTLLWAVTDSLSVAPAVRPSMSYTVPDDFTFLGSVALQPFALTVNAKLPIQSVEDLVAYAKKHPGKLNFASAGVGSVPHMGNVLINSSANIEMVHVPFSGLGPAVNAVIAGTVELGLATPSLMRPHVEAGTARVLAVTSESRFNGLPNIPTLKESGIDVIAVNSYGLIAPAGLQPSVVDRLLDVMKAIASDKALSDRLEKLGFTPVALIGDNYKDYITRDLEQWRSVAKRAGISIGK